MWNYRCLPQIFTLTSATLALVTIIYRGRVLRPMSQDQVVALCWKGGGTISVKSLCPGQGIKCMRVLRSTVGVGREARKVTRGPRTCRSPSISWGLILRLVGPLIPRTEKGRGQSLSDLPTGSASPSAQPWPLTLFPRPTCLCVMWLVARLHWGAHSPSNLFLAWGWPLCS